MVELWRRPGTSTSCFPTCRATYALCLPASLARSAGDKNASDSPAWCRSSLECVRITASWNFLILKSSFTQKKAATKTKKERDEDEGEQDRDAIVELARLVIVLRCRLNPHHCNRARDKGA